jgi:hypothetical protein
VPKTSERKDGIDRPDPGVMDKTKTLDSFAMDVSQAVTNMTALYKLFPQMRQLEALARKLERDGKLRVEMGQDYSGAALDYLLTEHGLPKSSS